MSYLPKKGLSHVMLPPTLFLHIGPWFMATAETITEYPAPTTPTAANSMELSIYRKRARTVTHIYIYIIPLTTSLWTSVTTMKLFFQCAEIRLRVTNRTRPTLTDFCFLILCWTPHTLTHLHIPEVLISMCVRTRTIHTLCDKVMWNSHRRNFLLQLLKSHQFAWVSEGVGGLVSVCVYHL